MLINMLAKTAEQAYMPLVSIDLSTIVLSLCNLLIIVLLYRFFLHKRVSAMLEQRRLAVIKEMDDATKAKEAAETAEKEYLAHIANSKEEAEAIIAVATKKAQDRESEIIAEAEENAALIKEKAEENIAHEKKRALNEIKDQISDIVIMAASKVVEKEIDEKDNKKLIDSFLGNVGM